MVVLVIIIKMGGDGGVSVERGGIRSHNFVGGVDVGL